MMLRSHRGRCSVLLLLSSLLLAACGAKHVTQLPDEDAAAADATPPDAAVDAGEVDAGDIDAGECPDVDGDGHGAAPCGDDCDDTAVDVNPAASESCNGGVDDDCNGAADLADGVCVPCGIGYTGVDGACTDIDECVSTPCGVFATACLNILGSYACSCLPGYGAPTTGGICADLDECALGTCGPGSTDCTNSAGSYVCSCAAGYAAAGSSAPCMDIDECGDDTEDCDLDPLAICANTAGSFMCTCPTGFAGGADAGHGTDGCLLSDPSLSSLIPSPGALSPAFYRGTTTYTLAAASGTTSVTLSPTVAYPARATITVDGLIVASGAASAPVSVPLGFAPRPVLVTVTTETGATRTYTVVVGRASTYVKASNTDPYDGFGYAVALSADGSTLAIGAYAEASDATGVEGNQTNNTGFESGAVYVFTRTGTTWSQQAYVKASNTGAYDFFGTVVAISADGSTLAVGAYLEDSSAFSIGGDQTSNTAPDSGAVYVFTRTGTTWAQQAYVKASNTGAGDHFGIAVVLSADGSTLAVGADREASSATGIGGDQTNDAAPSAGAAYVFTRAGTTWSQQAYLKASNTGRGDKLGYAIALSADGSTLAAGAYLESSNAIGIDGDQTNNAASSSGAVYVFTRAGTTWSQQAYVKASNTGAEDHFGYAIALTSDGATLAVGAPSESSNATGIGGDQTSNAMTRAGAAYVFTRAGSTWFQQAYVKASNTGWVDYFGVAVALSSDGSTLAVGAQGEASSATGIGGDGTIDAAANAGAAYVFTRAGTMWSQQAYAKASNTTADDRFGSALALSGDGSTLAIGAPREASSATGIDGDQMNEAAIQAGAVYVY